MPAIKKIAGLHQAREAHLPINGPDTGSNLGERQITKKKLLGHPWSKVNLKLPKCDSSKLIIIVKSKRFLNGAMQKI